MVIGITIVDINLLMMSLFPAVSVPHFVVSRILLFININIYTILFRSFFVLVLYQFSINIIFSFFCFPSFSFLASPTPGWDKFKEAWDDKIISIGYLCMKFINQCGVFDYLVSVYYKVQKELEIELRETFRRMKRSVPQNMKEGFVWLICAGCFNINIHYLETL